MSFNKSKKRKNVFNNFIKNWLFGKGAREKKILFGKANGIKMLLDPTYRFQTIIGLYEKEVQTKFTEYSKKCIYFFDVGAADGYYSLLYKKFNPPGEIFLFDADEKSEKLQKINFEFNKINNYHSYSKCVSDKNDAENISLDTFNLSGKKIFLKIDVEGGELFALKGMQQMLLQNNCYIILETHSQQLEDDCIDFLRSNNYKTKIVDNAWWRIILRERRPLDLNRWMLAYK